MGNCLIHGKYFDPKCAQCRELLKAIEDPDDGPNYASSNQTDETDNEN